MPQYDFRCLDCHTEFSIRYKSISAYADATPQCPECTSTRLDRIIKKVAVSGAQSHDFANMNSNEMLSVLESGDDKAVKALYSQVGTGTNPAQALPHHEQAKSLLDAKHKPDKPAKDKE